MSENNDQQMFAWQVNRDAALRSHALDSEWQKAMHDSAMKFAIEAVKAICLISGGSVVVGLAFVGSIYSAEPALAKALVTPIFMLAAGAVSATICAALSYVTQYFYARGSMSKSYTWEHPYVMPVAPALRSNIFGGIAHVMAVLSALSSFVFMIWGGYCGWVVLST
jgi:small-conductance mechanosensitive channel